METREDVKLERKIESSEAEISKAKSSEVEGPETEEPKAEGLMETEEEAATGEETGPGPKRKAREEEKALSIICWQVLSLFFMHFRHYFSLLNCLALVFPSFSSIESFLKLANIILSLQPSLKSRPADLSKMSFLLIFSKYNN